MKLITRIWLAIFTIVLVASFVLFGLLTRRPRYGIGGGGEPSIMAYVPIAIKQTFPSYGVQVDSTIKKEWAPLIIPERIYQTNLKWTEIELTPGVYTWQLWLLDKNIKYFGKNPFIVGAKTTPEQYRLWPEFQGSPPRDDSFDDYGNFVVAICQRYHPWAIELYNEPDTSNELVDNATQSYYGAWINYENDYFGAGQRYGRMTNVVYPMVKEACPETKIIAGALVGHEYWSILFLDGMLDADLKTDYISFHKYIRGPNMFGLIDSFSRLVSARTNLPQIVTETSVISDSGGDVHEQVKADYIRYLRSHYPNDVIQIVDWFPMFNEWLNTALAPNGVPLPAYYAWAEEYYVGNRLEK